MTESAGGRYQIWAGFALKKKKSAWWNAPLWEKCAWNTWFQNKLSGPPILNQTCGACTIKHVKCRIKAHLLKVTFDDSLCCVMVFLCHTV